MGKNKNKKSKRSKEAAQRGALEVATENKLADTPLVRNVVKVLSSEASEEKKREFLATAMANFTRSNFKQMEPSIMQRMADKYSEGYEAGRQAVLTAYAIEEEDTKETEAEGVLDS